MKEVFLRALPCLAVLGSAGVAQAANIAGTVTHSTTILATVVAVPEPATITMLGTGLAGLVMWKKHRK